MSPRSREANSRKKSLFSAKASRALLKEAKRVDIHDPTQTFLPPKQVNPKSRISKDKKTEPRKFSGDNDDIHRLHFDRNVLNLNIPKQSQRSVGSDDRLSLSELHISE